MYWNICVALHNHLSEIYHWCSCLIEQSVSTSECLKTCQHKFEYIYYQIYSKSSSNRVLHGTQQQVWNFYVAGLKYLVTSQPYRYNINGWRSGHCSSGKIIYHYIMVIVWSTPEYFGGTVSSQSDSTILYLRG